MQPGKSEFVYLSAYLRVVGTIIFQVLLFNFILQP